MKKFLFILSLILQSVSYAIGISPDYFEKQITKGETGYQEYVINNDSPNKLRYKVSFNPTDKNDTKELDISIYPKILFVEPYSKKTVKVLVKSKGVDLKKSEYKFNLVFSPITVPVLNSEESKSEKNIGISGSVGIGVLFEVVGYKKCNLNISEHIKISNFKVLDNRIKFDINNDLPHSLKLEAIVSDGKQEEAFLLPRIYTKNLEEINLNFKKIKKIKSLILKSKINDEEVFNKKF